jgi:tetratricopeptide (TPR) repeat protein
MIICLLLLLGMLEGAASPREIAGDDDFRRMDYASAAARYDSLLVTISPDSAQIFWRLARVQICMGDVAPGDQREEFYRTAEIWARRCVRASPALAAGHTWLAAALGDIAMFEGSKAKVQLSREIKNQLDQAIALDSTDDVAYSILGSFYLALGRVSWVERQLATMFLGSLPEGGFEDAEVALQHAIRLSPASIRHWYELGRVFSAEGKTADALAAFRQVGTLEPTLASDRRRKSRAAEWVNRLSEE